jgi:hypothetical protein
MKMKLDKKALLRKAKANQAATTSAKKGGSRIMIVSISVLVLLFAALPTTILLAVGMTPTLVALVVDITPGRYLTRCVAGLNVTGTVPFIGTLWSGVNDISSAIAIVSDPFAWLSMYGAAAIGWLLFLGLPGVVTVLRTLNAKRRVNALRETQQELLHEWGDTLDTPKPMSSSTGGGPA